jgi:hypothetical protein
LDVAESQFVAYDCSIEPMSFLIVDLDGSTELQVRRGDDVSPKILDDHPQAGTAVELRDAMGSQ